MPQVSISEAARLSGKARATIQRHIKTGILSVTKDRQGKPFIDTSELLRVYGQIKTGDSTIETGISQLEAATIEVLKEQLQQAREREKWLQEQLEESNERYKRLEGRMLPPGEPGEPGEAEAPKKGFFKRMFS